MSTAITKLLKSLLELLAATPTLITGDPAWLVYYGRFPEGGKQHTHRNKEENTRNRKPN